MTSSILSSVDVPALMFADNVYDPSRVGAVEMPVAELGGLLL